MNTIKKNNFGYYEFTDKPSEGELFDYYNKKYYQESKGSYSHKYTEDELKYINCKIEQKHLVLNKLIDTNKGISLLDVGCGEGWYLNYFSKQGWKVRGLDFSEFGCQTHNPECLQYVIVNNVFKTIEDLSSKNEKFDVIILKHVLEHVLDPVKLLKDLKKIVSNDGVLVVEVPNDYSILQNYLKKKNYVSEDYWLAYPDHLSYFNKEGLINLSKSCGWNCDKLISDFPIDLNLLNPHTNYINNKTLGKSCHFARVEIENLLHELSSDLALEIFQIFANLGLGRELIGFFKQTS